MDKKIFFITLDLLVLKRGLSLISSINNAIYRTATYIIYWVIYQTFIDL
jgi:hypothetical protein